jgi:ribose transport system permease protein
MIIRLPALRIPAAGRSLGLPLAIALLLFGFTLVEPSMMSATSIDNILVQTSFLFVAACAQLLVMLTRGFDLSIGANISIVSVASSMLMVAAVPLLGPELAVTAGILLGLAIGIVIGAANGALVSYLKINPFVVTLGTLSIVGGLATTISGGFPIFGLPAQFSYAFNQASWLFLPAPIVLSLGLALILHFVLSGTVHGRILYLLGDNAEAALVAGRRTSLHLFLAYVMCGSVGAIAGLMMTAETGSGEPNLGGSFILDSIAAAVVGGASLRGGIGGVSAPLLGALLVTVLSVGMNLTKVDGSLQPVVVGLVVVASTFIDKLKLAANAD